jgi:beta-galactosidase
MKRLSLFLLLVLSVVLLHAEEVRTDVLLNDGWSIRPISNPTPGLKGTAVTLPHTWNANYIKGTEYNRETMVYTRMLSVSSEMVRNSRLFLRFEGVNSVADVFVNRRTVGLHKGGYTAFCIEITDFVHEGDNDLEVWVGNAFRTDVLPISGDFNVYGGIHRPVHLLVTAKDCISPLYYGSAGVFIRQDNVTKERAELTVETKLSLRSGSRNLRLKTVMQDAQGSVVAEAENTIDDESVKQTFAIGKPILWNGRKNPYLYTVITELKDGEKVIDRQTEYTGLRYYSVDKDRGFFLNGEHYELRGFNRHEDVDGKGSALLPEDHELDMQMICETGATMIRLSHYPQSKIFYQLADRQGMVLWSEIPLVGPGGYDFTGYVRNVEENARQVALEMVYQNYNHPSVCFWGLFNEILVNDGRFREWDNPVDFVRSLNTLVKKADPSRLTTFATCVPHTYYLGCSDLMAWNKYFRKPGNEQKVRQFYAEARKTAGGQPLGISEYGDAGSVKIHYDPRYDRVRDHAENYQLTTHEGYWKAVKEEPWLWCKCIWQFCDMQTSIRHEGDRDGVNDKGMVTYDRKTRKDIYYFYKAQWNPEPMVYITGRRFVNRRQPVTDVKAYTNLPSATLYVNGQKIGKAKTDELGRLMWKDIQLSEGENRIMVKAGKLSDECVWNYGQQE